MHQITFDVEVHSAILPGQRLDADSDAGCRPCDVLRTVCEANGGTVFRADRNAIYATFLLPITAIKAALEGQLALIDTLRSTSAPAV